MEICSFAVLVAFLCALFCVTSAMQGILLVCLCAIAQLVSLCSVLYNVVIIFCNKTSVNAQPLSPSLFEEITAHKKKTKCSHVSCLRLRFFLCFIFVSIFGYHLPTPWARLASFWIDCVAIVGPTFPRFPPPALNSRRDFARNFARILQRTCRELSRNLQNEILLK